MLTRDALLPHTIAYVRWNARRSADGSVVLRRYLWLQIGIFGFIPLCAVFMARGL